MGTGRIWDWRCVIIGDDTLHVIDLKYGKGVKVDAVGNTQARLYAAGALDTFGLLYGFDKIRVHIYQPRIDNISTATIPSRSWKSG